MTAGRTTAPASTTFLRGALLLLSGMGAAGAAADLALARHWQTPIQYVPWAALVTLAAAIALVAVRPTRWRVLWGRALATVVVMTSAFGIYQHVRANYAAGPLDFRYTDTWAAMSPLARWWTAASESVGPSPTLAPAVLAYTGLGVWLATFRHPALVVADQARAEGVPVSTA
jgi:hypothetical protein